MSTIYSYPSNKDKQLLRREAPKRLVARKKLTRRLTLSVVASLVIAVIAVMSGNAIATVLLLMLSVLSLLVSVFAVKISLLSFEEEETVILDDYTMLHTTALMKGGKRSYKIKLSDVKKSYQNSVGDMVFELQKGVATITDKKGKKESTSTKEGVITVIIRTTKTKLFLINELNEIINYPKKNYNIIEDDYLDDDGFEKNWSEKL